MEYIRFILHIHVHLTEIVALYGMWIYGILFIIIFYKTENVKRKIEILKPNLLIYEKKHYISNLIQVRTTTLSSTPHIL